VLLRARFGKSFLPRRRNDQFFLYDGVISTLNGPTSFEFGAGSHSSSI